MASFTAANRAPSTARQGTQSRPPAYLFGRLVCATLCAEGLVIGLIGVRTDAPTGVYLGLGLVLFMLGAFAGNRILKADSHA